MSLPYAASLSHTLSDNHSFTLLSQLRRLVLSVCRYKFTPSGSVTSSCHPVPLVKSPSLLVHYQPLRHLVPRILCRDTLRVTFRLPHSSTPSLHCSSSLHFINTIICHVILPHLESTTLPSWVYFISVLVRNQSGCLSLRMSQKRKSV